MMSATTFKMRIARTNGWQRLWIVTTVATFLYFCLWFPLDEAGKQDVWRYQTRSAIEAEMIRQECANYMTAPLDQLKEPPFDISGAVGCYNIFTYRQFQEGKAPITAKSYEDSFESASWNALFTYVGIGFLLAMTLSGFTYGVGFIVAWIIRGFQRVP